MIKRPTKGPAPPKELFALGTKAKTEAEGRSLFGLKKLSGNASGINTGLSLKRGADHLAGSSISHASKRSRLGSGVTQAVGRSTDISETKSPAVYEDVAIDVDGLKLVESVMSSLNDTDRIEGLLCGAVKNLKSNKLKPDEAMYLGVMFLAKSKPELFQSEVVIEAFCSMLKKEANPTLKMRTNNLLSIIACNVFVMTLQDKTSWPDSFVKVFLDDSLGERLWVDQVECRTFVQNILTAFNTRLPQTVFQADLVPKPDTPGVALDSEEAMSNLLNEVTSGPTVERYAYQLSSIEPYVMELVRDQLSRRQPLDGGSRNLVRTLTFLCGLSEIRSLVVQRLDIWLQSPKLMKAAQDLLMAVCLNFNPKKCPQDLELINNLCRIRFKTKNLNSYFNSCLKELLTQNSENIPLLLQHIVSRELSNARNQNNLNFINVMLQQSENVVKLLADVILDQLMAREDNLKAVRVLLREIMRNFKADFNTFIFSLLQDKSNSRFRDLDPLMKERYITSVIDLVAMTMLLCINNSVREAASNPRADAKDMEALRDFQNQMSTLQRHAIWWLHSIVVKMMHIKSSDYMLCLKKILFVEKSEVYSRIDNWPPESERVSMIKLVSEVPLQEDMLLCIVLMGHNKELHLSIPELIDLLEIIVRRAASIYTEDFPVLKVDNTDFMAALLNLCAYKHPENSVLPTGYKPPSLAIMHFYWKAWQILLIISAFNPTSIGLKAWECYPTLKCLMEMAMTNNFCFPPVTMSVDESSADEIRSQEKQMAEFSKQQTLEFECHLAGCIITETNSRLLPQVCRMEIEGFLLKPPQTVLDSVRLLNQSLSLGKLLCQSREPADFLLNIIQRQGTSQSMPWLKDLVESNDSSLEVLPVQCLCEFLLHDIHDDAELPHADRRQQNNLKQEQLLVRLQNLVRSSCSEQKVMELINQTLSYFLERLSFTQSYSRKQATKCLSMILGHSAHEDDDEVKNKEKYKDELNSYQWLFEELPLLGHFEAIKMQLIMYIRAACQVETDITAVSAYIVFLSRHSESLNLQDLDDLVLDVAQLILERVSLINCLLPHEFEALSPKDSRVNTVLSSLVNLFHCHLSKARQPRNETYSWSNNQYQILLHWNSGQSAKMNILIVHATVIILAYGPPEGENHFDDLMDGWFPLNEQPPTAYLIDTSEEALLIPDWLKLRMIRSNVPRLIDASFGDAEIPQLLLFIQSFGISVNSMNKLLQHLDVSLENNETELLRLVLDKNYMAELIEVQHMRGAVGGEKFYKMLTGGLKELNFKQDDAILEPGLINRFLVAKQPTSTKSEKTHNDEIVDMLTKVFLDSESSKAEKGNAVRCLHKTARKPAGLINLVESCTQLICSARGTSFIDNLLKNPLYSCPLFRLIISGCHMPVAEDLCNVILSRSDNPTNLLSRLLSERNNNSDGSFLSCNPSVKAKEEKLVDVNEELTEEQVAKKLQSLVSLPSQMEVNLTSTLIPFIKQVDSSSNVLKALYELYNATCNSLSSGLALDCLELFNPPIVQPDLLQQLLDIVFKRDGSSKPENKEIFAPQSPVYGNDEDIEEVVEVEIISNESYPSHSEYLLCLLLHRSGWTNLIQVINHLLPNFSSDVYERYDSGTILDFIEACFNVPNLWQGRCKMSKHSPIEDILSLNLNQVKLLASMAIEEQLQRDMKHPLDDDKITCRLNLLESCCSGKRSKLVAVVETFYHMQETHDRDVVAVFLWGMYLRVPQVYIQLPHTLYLTEQSMNKFFTDSSHLDIATQHMITCLLDVSLSSGRLDENKLHNATMVSRKLASQHPLIFLRQLPLLSSFLEGHAQFLSADMRVRNLSPMFTNVLAILYLLQPYIFHPFHTAAFHSIIDSYAQIISVYGFSARSPIGLVKKYLEIVFNYFHHSPIQASSCLKKHMLLLRGLEKQHKDFQMFQRFILRLSCFDETNQRKLFQSVEIRQGDKLDINIAKTSEIFSFTFAVSKCLPFNLAVKSPPAWEVCKFFNLNQKTNRSYVQTTAELIDGLKELDEASRSHIEILEDFKGNIDKLIFDLNSDCRVTGHSLMMRLLRHNPKSGRMFHQSLNNCLKNENFQIVQESFETLKEFTILVQDHAVELLLYAFKAGLTWSTDVTPHINETLQILNLQLTTH